MSTIKYEIEFFSNWHCGSGLAAGADVDALVIKDNNGLPYVPGRTLKGLLRDAATNLSVDKVMKMVIRRAAPSLEMPLYPPQNTNTSQNKD